jgi:hypothetical protein
MYKNAKFCIVSQRVPSLPCILSHCTAIRNVPSLDIQYHSWSINSILVSINMKYSTCIIRYDILYIGVSNQWFHSLETIYCSQWCCHVQYSNEEVLSLHSFTDIQMIPFALSLGMI